MNNKPFLLNPFTSPINTYDYTYVTMLRHLPAGTLFMISKSSHLIHDTIEDIIEKIKMVERKEEVMYTACLYKYLYDKEDDAYNVCDDIESTDYEVDHKKQTFINVDFSSLINIHKSLNLFNINFLKKENYSNEQFIRLLKMGALG